MTDDATDWSERRRAAAQAHAEALAATQAAESARARQMLADFVAEAAQRGLEPEPLLVQGYGGRGTARSQVRGWYLRRDRTVGVGEDGEFYVLTAPLSLIDRVRGVRVTPTPPPLVIGKGGRDGETMDMRDAISRALANAPGPADS